MQDNFYTKQIGSRQKFFSKAPVPPSNKKQDTNSEIVKPLFQKYRIEFEEVFESLITFAAAIQSRMSSLNQKLFIAKILLKYSWVFVLNLQNLSPLTSVPIAEIISIFAWAFVLQVGFFVASTISSVFFYPIIGLVFSRFMAFLLAFILLPSVFFLYIDKNELEKHARFKMLVMTLAQGIFVGFIFRNYNPTFVKPLSFLTPLSVVLSAQFFLPTISRPRFVVLGSCVGSVFATHLIAGLMFFQLSFAYLFLALLHSVIVYATLQFYLEYDECLPIHFYMFGFFVASLWLETMFSSFCDILYRSCF